MGKERGAGGLKGGRWERERENFHPDHVPTPCAPHTPYTHVGFCFLMAPGASARFDARLNPSREGAKRAHACSIRLNQ